MEYARAIILLMLSCVGLLAQPLTPSGLEWRKHAIRSGIVFEWNGMTQLFKYSPLSVENLSIPDSFIGGGTWSIANDPGYEDQTKLTVITNASRTKSASGDTNGLAVNLWDYGSGVHSYVRYDFPHPGISNFCMGFWFRPGSLFPSVPDSAIVKFVDEDEFGDPAGSFSLNAGPDGGGAERNAIYMDNDPYAHTFYATNYQWYFFNLKYEANAECRIKISGSDDSDLYDETYTDNLGTVFDYILIGGTSTGNGAETNYSYFDSVVFLSPLPPAGVFPFSPF